MNRHDGKITTPHQLSYEVARTVVQSTQMALDHLLMNAALRRDFDEVLIIRGFRDDLYERTPEIRDIESALQVLGDLRASAEKSAVAARSDPDGATPIFDEIDAVLSEQMLSAQSDRVVPLDAYEPAARRMAGASELPTLAHDAALRGLDRAVMSAALFAQSHGELDEVVDWVDRAKRSIAMQYLTLSSQPDALQFNPEEVRDDMLHAMGVPTPKKLGTGDIPMIVRLGGISNLIPRGFEYMGIACDNAPSNHLSVAPSAS